MAPKQASEAPILNTHLKGAQFGMYTKTDVKQEEFVFQKMAETWILTDWRAWNDSKIRSTKHMFNTSLKAAPPTM